MSHRDNAHGGGGKTKEVQGLTGGAGHRRLGEWRGLGTRQRAVPDCGGDKVRQRSVFMGD